MTEEEARRIESPYRQDKNRMFSHPFDPEKCCASVQDRISRNIGQCQKKPSYFYGSLGYCGTHNPQRQIDRNLKWDAENEARKAKIAYESAMREYTAACVELVERLAGIPITHVWNLDADVIRPVRKIAEQKPTSAEAQGE